MSYSEECGLEISNSLDIKDPQTVLEKARQQLTREALNIPSQPLSLKPALPKHKLDEQEDLRRYRRVRLRLTQRRFRLKVYELRNNNWHDAGTGFGKHTVLQVRLYSLSSHF